MEKTDILIIGAGVIGLAIAERLSSSGKDIILVEKNDGFGRETSSRNSEVIHAGMYYPENSLKASLCVEGNRMLYELCEEKSIPYRKTGKIIIAANDEEIEKINNIYEQGRLNGVEELELLTKTEIKNIEPFVNGKMGIYSPETGIVDTHQLMKYLEQNSKSNGVIIAYNCRVEAISREAANFAIDICDADDEIMHIQSSIVINAAGLSSDRIAEFSGIDINAACYKLYPCKGEYFSVSGRHKGKLKHLVYPIPSSISLGIHTVLNLDKSIKLGPNAFFIDTIDYKVDPSHQEEFYYSVSKFLPFIGYDDLSPDMAGIRPKLQKEGDDFHDFVIAEESTKAMPGFINLIGIDSPGLTACLSIAEKVKNMVG